MAKGRPIVQAMELTNPRALLHELQPPMLLAILAQTDLVLVDVEGYVLRGSVLLCLLIWNRVLLAVAALERLTLPVWHSMRTPLLAGALRDSQRWLRVPCNSGPSACLLRGLCRTRAMLRVNCKLVELMMKGVQADTLRAATHLLVGVGEATNAS